MKAALALFLTILAPSYAAAESVTYHRLGSSIYGSDGSRTYRMGGSTYIEKHDRTGVLRTTTCSKLGSFITCR